MCHQFVWKIPEKMWGYNTAQQGLGDNRESYWKFPGHMVKFWHVISCVNHFKMEKFNTWQVKNIFYKFHLKYWGFIALSCIKGKHKCYNYKRVFLSFICSNRYALINTCRIFFMSSPLTVICMYFQFPSLTRWQCNC